MKRSASPLPFVIVPAALVVAWLAAREQHRNGRPWTFLVSEITPGLALIAAGLLICIRRPQNRCWWLLVVAGFAWYIGNFEHSRDEDVGLFGFALAGWHNVLLAWAILAFPSGRLHQQYDKALTIGLAAALTARSLSRILLHVPPDVAGYGTTNRFLPISNDRWWRLVEDAFAVTFTAGIVLVLAMTARRWIASSTPTRRMLTPALLAATVLAGAVAYEQLIGWNARVPGGRGLRIFYIVSWSHAAMAVALAVGLLRLRHTRSAVVDLVAELGQDAPPSRLGEALSRALGDPSLRLLAWSADGHYVDDHGRRAEPPNDDPNRAITRIERQGEPIAVLVHDRALLEDPGLVNAVVAAVRLTIDNEHLQAEIQNQLAEVAASRSRIMAAGDAERRRIERDLHDGAQQRLVTIALALRLADARLAGGADPRVQSVLSQAVDDLGEAIEELRNLAHGIHPAILSESGLAVALESLVDRSPVPVSLDVDLPEQPPAEIAAAAYFAVSEALTNVAKHADASSVTLRALARDDTIHIEVIDDGRGGADTQQGTGLRGIADRVSTVGGTLRIQSPLGGGTRFEVELPCESS